MRDLLAKLLAIPVVVLNIAVLITVFGLDVLALIYGVSYIGDSSLSSAVVSVLYIATWFVANLFFWELYFKIYVKALELAGLDKPVFDSYYKRPSTKGSTVSTNGIPISNDLCPESEDKHKKSGDE